MRESNLRLFVVGEQGQVARAIDRECARRKYGVQLAGRKTVNLSDRRQLVEAISAFRPAVVINAAAYTAVDQAELESEAAFAINRDGARNAAIAANSAGAPLIHISTDYVYDGTKAAPYVETDATNPLSVYGASKLAGEVAVAEVSGSHIILRTSWIYSQDGMNFVKTMLRLAGQREEIAVVDDQYGAPTFAGDLANALLTIAEDIASRDARQFQFHGQTYHAAGSGETTWFGLASAVMEASAKRGGPACRLRAISTAEYPTRAVRPKNSRLDCSKLEHDFGIGLPRWQSSLSDCLGQLIPDSR